MPKIVFSSIDLPEPDEPVIATISPGMNLREMSFKTGVGFKSLFIVMFSSFNSVQTSSISILSISFIEIRCLLI